LAGQHSDHDTPQNPEKIAAGRKLGTDIASDLVKDIRAMGMPANREDQTADQLPCHQGFPRFHGHRQ